MVHWWNNTDREKLKYLVEKCTSATLYTTNPTWTGPGSNPGLCNERSVTNYLSHGKAHYGGAVAYLKELRKEIKTEKHWSLHHSGTGVLDGCESTPADGIWKQTG